jgi:ferric enterobactin receptor
VQWLTDLFLLNLEMYRKNNEGVLEQKVGLNSLSHLQYELTQNNSYSEGFDVLIQKKIDKFSGWISYSYNNAEMNSKYNNLSLNYPLNTSIRHNLKIAGMFEINNFNVSITYQAVSGRVYTIPDLYSSAETFLITYCTLISPELRNQFKLPATHQVDLSLSYGITYKNISSEINLSIYNILNLKNIWYRSFTIEEGKLQSIDVEMLGFKPLLSLNIRFN